MRILWSVLLIALIACQGANANGKVPSDASAPDCATAAEDPNDPNELLWKKWDAVIKDPNKPSEMLWAKWSAVVNVLQEKNLTQTTKGKIIDKIVTPIFDFPLMAKLVLGRTYWPQFTEPQREKFTKIFTNKLKTSYREKISLYTDEKASLKPAQRMKTAVYIPMELTSKDKKMAILYKMIKVGKGWKVFDVEIERVSILLTYRSQFDDMLRKDSDKDGILREGSAEEFLRNLEKQPAHK